MKIETKFDLGQAVWLVKKLQHTTYIPCPGCAGHGDILLVDRTTGRCPKCYGRKTRIDVAHAAWHVTGPMTIGNVRVSLFGVQSTEDERRYMCHETGVGSGTLWREPDLFATREEAEAEAGKRREQGEE